MYVKDNANAPHVPAIFLACFYLAFGCIGILYCSFLMQPPSLSSGALYYVTPSTSSLNRTNIKVITNTTSPSFKNISTTSTKRPLSVKRIIDTINLHCEKAFVGNETGFPPLVKFSFDWDALHQRVMNSTNRCKLYRSEFGFDKTRSSFEEKEFPLAYGVVAHNRFEQLLLLLSSVYEKQNKFCIAVPSNSDQDFIHLAHGFADCFPNIYIVQVGPVSWGSYEIMRGTYDCMELLLNKDKSWKYFQYLSGVDSPMRTNFEMVRILKEWDELSYLSIYDFDQSRLNGKKDPPVKLFKPSLSAIISRKSAKGMINQPLSRKLIDFLKGTHVADESYWASALGNAKDLPIHGSFNASEFQALSSKYKDVKKPNTTLKCENPPCLSDSCVGRFQIWGKCKGKKTNGSCVFGVADLQSIMESAAFVAHKLYGEHEPAALFCMLKEIDRRRSHPDPKFNATQYRYLPLIEFAKGIRNFTRPDLSC